MFRSWWACHQEGSIQIGTVYSVYETLCDWAKGSGQGTRLLSELQIIVIKTSRILSL